MKKLITLILIFLVLTACESKPFTGYIVAKEYVEGHMCHDEDYQHYVEAYVPVVPHVPPVHHHEWQESEFIIYVANRYQVNEYNVDSLDFYNYNLLDKVTFE
jgi:hypothetical protein